jgi:predicted ATPase/DNA-binding SARP family transcriptional activator
MLEFKLLGQFEVLRDGRLLTVPTRNAQSLLAYLVIQAGKAYRREKLAGMLWPDSSEENARSNLRHELWRLRKVLGKDGEAYLLIDEINIAFNTNSQYALDTDVLECLPLEDSTAEDLMLALSAYRGELLPGFYEEWVTSERERLSALYEAKMNRLLEILQTEGRWEEVLEWAMRWLHVGHWPEPAYRALMTAYASKGDLPKAAATYERFAQGLQKDLGLKPSEQTLALLKRIKTGWKEDAQVKAGPQGVLKSKAPSEASLKADATLFTLHPVRRSNLPNPLTSFIGREKEIQKVAQLVFSARLVTITGAGGVGKTRLAIQVARSLDPHFKDGVWWIDLAPLFKGAPVQKPSGTPIREGPGAQVGVGIVVQAVSKALRVPESPNLSLLEGVLEYLYTRKLLLVLDNCEHLIEECAVLSENVLVNCAEVVILATSREALGVPGEKAWLLPSLSLPGRGASFNAESILHSEAVNLFVERAGDSLPGYEPDDAGLSTIVQICLSLGGIPLAIELAAARMNLLSVQEISARLESRFSLLTAGHRTVLPRHKTLQAAIEWSYDLLSETEQVLFRRLAIFSGSFTLEAVEAICAGQEVYENEVLTLIGRLVNKSLLNVEQSIQNTDLPTRYRFLDTICSYGRLKLEEAEGTHLFHVRHAAYYVRLVEAAEPELLLQNQVHWFKLLQAEHDNLLAVIEWSAESEQAESALRLVGALMWFWFSYGSTREGRDLSLKALAIPPGTQLVQPKEARARALSTAGFLLCLLGEVDLGRQLLEEALSIQSTFEDKTTLAWSLQFLGLALAYDQQYDQADAAFQEGLAITKKFSGGQANNFLHFLGDIEMLRGDPSRAKQIYEESVNLLRVIGNKSFLAYPLRRLGYLALREHDIPKAWSYFQESLAINLEIGDKRGFAACLVWLATLAMQLGKPIAAARLYGAVERRLDALSVNLLYMDQAELKELTNKFPTSIDGATFAAAFREGWGLSEEQAIKTIDELYEREIAGKS